MLVQLTRPWIASGSLKLSVEQILYRGVSAYFYWEGIEVTTNNGGLIQISGTTVNPSGRLWAYAQWSRSVRPCAVRIATSGAPSGVKTSAFKNVDGTFRFK